MIKRLLGALALACAVLVPSLAQGQTAPLARAPAGNAPIHAECFGRKDGTCYQAAGIVFADGATSRSGTITTGGTAQDLMAANSARNGWEVQNQSNDNCYIRSKGLAGTTVATQDQNSLLLQPGAYYTPQHISTYAMSIICPTTGDAFYAREW